MPDPAYLDPVFEANFPDEAASSRLKAKDYEEAKVSKSLVTQACWLWMDLFTQAGQDYYLIIEKKDTDFTGRKCNKVGADNQALSSRSHQCHRKAYT